MARAVAIWTCGILASGIIGALIGGAMSYGNEAPGFLAGILAFTCFRLWRSGPKKDLA
jgi:hypothetical protein